MSASSATRVCLLLVISSGVIASAVAADLSEEDARTLRTAQELLESRNFQRAVELLEPLKRRYPDQGDVPRLLAHANYGLEKPEEARAGLIEALSLGRMTPDVFALLARIDQERGDEVSMTNAVQLLTILDSANRDWRLLHGDLKSAAGDFEESLRTYQKLLEQQPNNAGLHLRLGNVYQQTDQLWEAAQSLEMAWRLGVTQGKLPLVLGGIWQQIGDDRQAISWLQRAADTGESNEELQLRIARLHWNLGELEHARKRLEPLTGSAEMKVAAPACVLLGLIALRQDQVEQATGYWEKAVAAGASDRELLERLGAHFYNAGNFSQAARYLQQAVDAGGGDVEKNLRFLIVSLIRSGDSVKTREYLRRYIEHNGLTEQANELIQYWSRQSEPGSPSTPPSSSKSHSPSKSAAN